MGLEHGPAYASAELDPRARSRQPDVGGMLPSRRTETQWCGLAWMLPGSRCGIPADRTAVVFFTAVKNGSSYCTWAWGISWAQGRGEDLQGRPGPHLVPTAATPTSRSSSSTLTRPSEPIDEAPGGTRLRKRVALGASSRHRSTLKVAQITTMLEGSTSDAVGGPVECA